jgi:hypothetical protein
MASAAAGNPAGFAPRTAAVRPQAKTPGVAWASLVLSVGSLVLGPFGFIPGIICGHIAQRRLKRDVRLGGRGVARAGLLVGYGFLVLSVVFLAVFATLFVKTAKQIQQQTIFSGNSAPGGQASPAASMASGPVADSDAWKTDLQGISIPNTPLTGRVHGQSFICDHAEMSPALKPCFLTLQHGEGLQGDQKITLIIPDGIEGRSINLLNTGQIPADQDYRVAILWRANGQYHPQQFTRAQNGFVVRLECEPRAQDRIKGRIYLCLGDEQHSYVAGSFDAKLR